MTLLDPSRAVENLIYIGYPGDPSAAVCITRRRRLDRKKQQSDRNVLQCFVLGPKNAGKSALLNSFIGRFVFRIHISKLRKEGQSVNILSDNLHSLIKFDTFVVHYCGYRPFSDAASSTTEDRYAVNVVDLPGVSSFAFCIMLCNLFSLSLVWGFI